MSKPESLVFEVLNKGHDRTKFDCGVEPLDQYLIKRAGQEQRRNVAFSYVMTMKGSDSVKGYYTLSASSVLVDKLPQELAKVTRYEFVPAVLIGRLALDKSLHKKGYSSMLLVDALRRVGRSKDFAVMLVIVDAKNKEAEAFYKKYGFMPLGDENNRLYIPYKTIASL